ncbi:hypothetical protein C9890_0668 [Perkinsus sp. BL_2016]|nr:hypothetical protein C9890_0668 [Perkinsus sp. BL_2016]
MRLTQSTRPACFEATCPWALLECTSHSSQKSGGQRNVFEVHDPVPPLPPKRLTALPQI